MGAACEQKLSRIKQRRWFEHVTKRDIGRAYVRLVSGDGKLCMLALMDC